MSYEKMQQEIINLKIDFTSESEAEALNVLHDQFIRAGNTSFSKNELQDMIKSDVDVLTDFDQDSYFYESVRNIQDEIIGFFAEADE